MYKKTVLDNGIRIVTERIPSRTVSVGVWVGVGARYEHDLNNGTSHFVEHMLFKGTETRNAQQIACQLDVLGGTANAFTSSETTCYYATVLDSHIDDLADLFSDFFLHSKFDQEEVSREQQVILQEMSMVEDTPDDQIHDLFNSLHWGAHPLGNTVLGSREVVASMDSAKLRDYVRRCYTSDKILIAAAGNVDHDHFVSLWRDKFALLAPADKKVKAPVPAAVSAGRHIINKQLEQVHLILGGPGLEVCSPRRYAMLLLNIIFGGNMSSRLFQEIREKRGLAYSIYSFLTTFSDCGYLATYVGTEESAVHEACDLIRLEQEKVRETAVSAEELKNAQEYAKGGMFLAAENMEARMTRLARNEVYFGRDIPFDEVVAEIDRVGVNDIQALAADLVLPGSMNIAAIGPLDTGDLLGGE